MINYSYTNPSKWIIYGIRRKQNDMVLFWVIIVQLFVYFLFFVFSPLSSVVEKLKCKSFQMF